MTFPVIITAIIALTILIVMLSIYTGFIGKSAADINKPADEAGKQANDAAWCISAYVGGQDCVVEDASSCESIEGTSCNPAKLKFDVATKKCSLCCESGQTVHKVAGGEDDRSYNCKDGGKLPEVDKECGEVIGGDLAKRYCCCK